MIKENLRYFSNFWECFLENLSLTTLDDTYQIPTFKPEFFFSFFFLSSQNFDVVELMIIQKMILANLAIKNMTFYIFGYLLELHMELGNSKQVQENLRKNLQKRNLW
jgi:hypothetical protein